jgi:hypothetical protein
MFHCDGRLLEPLTKPKMLIVVAALCHRYPQINHVAAVGNDCRLEDSRWSHS